MHDERAQTAKATSAEIPGGPLFETDSGGGKTWMHNGRAATIEPTYPLRPESSFRFQCFNFVNTQVSTKLEASQISGRPPGKQRSFLMSPEPRTGRFARKCLSRKYAMRLRHAAAGSDPHQFTGVRGFTAQTASCQQKKYSPNER